jgi:NodT family efflux transporter outer membrane factor (OMF) lipoprotein
VPLPADWSASSDPRLGPKIAVDVAWWHSFNDPALDHLVELAYHQNPSLQIAGLRILEARAQVGIAVGQQWPSNPGAIAGVGLAGLNEHNASAGDIDLISGRYQVGFDALWEVDFWGKFRRGVKAAKATFLATIADYDDALVALTAEVARTYALIRIYETEIAIARENVTVQEEGQHIAEARFKNGATSELDVAQATAILETTRATIPELQISLQQAKNALCTLIGRAPGCADPLLTGASVIPTPPGQVGVSVPAEMLRRRPDIRGAELRAVAQCDRIGVAKTDLFPKLTLFGSVGTLTLNSTGAPATASSLLNLFNPGTLIYSLGASLFWPILSYPQIMNNVRVQDARLQELLADYQSTVLRAAQEVENGIVGYLREQESAVFSANAVKASKDAVHLAVVQYREGAADFTRVLDAQRALLSSQDQLVRTQGAVVTNLIALYKALGGGWQVRIGQPAVSDTNREEMQKRTNWGSYFNKPPPQPPQTNGSPPSAR